MQANFGFSDLAHGLQWDLDYFKGNKKAPTCFLRKNNFSETGWIQISESTQEECGLSGAFNVASILRHFLVRQAADNLPADDTRNLEESIRLYGGRFVHEAEYSMEDNGKIFS